MSPRRAIALFPLRCLALLALTLALLARPAWGQFVYEEEQEDAIKPLALKKYDGKFFLETRHRRDNETRNGSPINEVETDLREGVEFDLAGYAYHPNLLDWIANLQVGSTQNFLDINGGNRDSIGELLGFNFEGQVLKEKPVTGRITAGYSSNYVDRTFAQGIQRDAHHEGVELRSIGNWPFLFSYLHQTSTEENEARTDDETSHLFHFEISDARNPDRLTQLVLEREDVEKTTVFTSSGAAQDFPDHRTDLTLRNDWLYGDEVNPIRLSGQLRFIDRAGFFNNQVFSFDQTLDITHDPTLSSFYNVNFSQSDTDSDSVRSFGGSAGVRKSIYDSLVITANLSALTTEFTGGSESTYGGDLVLDYTKETPLGTYTSSLSLGRDYETENSDTGLRRFDNNNLTLTGNTYVDLPQTNVVTGSVVVTDLTGVPLIENVDYQLDTLGSVTRIRRLNGGAIADGDTVRVAFTSNIATDVQYTRDTLEWSHRFTFEEWPIAIYFTYRRFDEQVISGADPGNLDFSQSWLVGAEWNWQGFNLTGEHEVRESRLSLNTTRDLLRLSYSLRVSRNTVASAGGSYLMLRYTNLTPTVGGNNADFVETYNAFANVTTKVTARLLLRGYADYAQSQGRQEDLRVRVGGGLQWHYGKMDVALDSYYTLYEQNSSEGDTIFINLKVTRHF